MKNLHLFSRERELSATVRLLSALLSVSTTVSFFISPTENAPASAGVPAMAFTISSSAFSNGGGIPKKFTCDGPDASPQLVWTEPPSGTKSFSLLVDDPDAPVGNWNHWTAWNLPTKLRDLPEAVSKDARIADGTEQGRNDFGKTGYNGPCPPPGKPHRYYFKLFALDTKLDLKAGARKKELENAMQGHILGQAEWMGTYGR